MSRRQKAWLAFWALLLYGMAFANGYSFGVKQTVAKVLAELHKKI